MVYDDIGERQDAAEHLLNLADLHEERGALLRQLSDEVLQGNYPPEKAADVVLGGPLDES